MPYKDPEKRRQVQRESSKRARERDPERYAGYQKKWLASLTPEQKAERRRKYVAWQIATGRRDAEPKRRPKYAHLTREAFAQTPDDPRHGTLNGYNNLKCRCDRCRDANRVDHARYMAMRREIEKGFDS